MQAAVATHLAVRKGAAHKGVEGLQLPLHPLAEAVGAGHVLGLGVFSGPLRMREEQARGSNLGRLCIKRRGRTARGRKDERRERLCRARRRLAMRQLQVTKSHLLDRRVCLDAVQQPHVATNLTLERRACACGLNVAVVDETAYLVVGAGQRVKQELGW